MDGVWDEFVPHGWPDRSDDFVGCEEVWGLGPARDVAGCHDVRQMGAERVVIVLIDAFEGLRDNDPPGRSLIRFSFLDRTVHPLDLPIRP